MRQNQTITMMTDCNMDKLYCLMVKKFEHLYFIFEHLSEIPIWTFYSLSQNMDNGICITGTILFNIHCLCDTITEMTIDVTYWYFFLIVVQNGKSKCYDI